jgi:hypothetical protein
LRIGVIPVGGEVLDGHLVRHGFLDDVAHANPP